MPKRRPKTRDRILAAAREVFAEVGFSGFTMTEVERRVGLAVGTGSIYRHFRSREALLQAVMETELRLHRDATAKRAPRYAKAPTRWSDE